MSKKCFIIIPFSAHYESIFEHVLKPALAELDVDAFISKDVKGMEWPFIKIHDGIKNSRFCIADITEPNENVMYEIGYASALDKKIILIWDKSRRASNPSFDVNYFHGEPYNSQEDKTWSYKLARVIKGHFEVELAKPTGEKPSGKKRDDIALDDLSLKIIAAIAVAKAQHQIIGVNSMIELMVELGSDRVDVSLTLDDLLRKEIIDRTYNTQGDHVCEYYNRRAANELLRLNQEAFKQMRNHLPKDFSRYAPASAWPF